MKFSPKQKAIILHLSPKISRTASLVVPFDEFRQMGQAVLKDICLKTPALHPDLPVRTIRDIVFEETVYVLATSARVLLEGLQSGMGEGRVTLSANGESFLVDLRSVIPKG